MKTPAALAGFLLITVPAMADNFASSSFSSAADVERVSRTQQGSKIFTTRQVKVKLRNMSPATRQTAGIECWMFYRDLRTHQVGVQHHERTVVTLDAGDWREVVADKQLFEYTPDQVKTFSHGRIGMVRRIPGSGHKYEGFVVRVFENGRVTREVSTSGSLTKLVDEAWQSYSDSAQSGSKKPAKK